jgi:C4-type Zn-finger protein
MQEFYFHSGKKSIMIIFSIKANCPVCDEMVELDISSPDVKVEACRDEILLSFKCKQCGEHIDQECWEKE